METNNNILEKSFDIFNKSKQFKEEYGYNALKTLLKNIMTSLDSEIIKDNKKGLLDNNPKDIDEKSATTIPEDTNLSIQGSDVSIYAQDPDILKRVREDITTHGDNNIIKEEDKAVARVLEPNYNKIPNPYE